MADDIINQIKSFYKRNQEGILTGGIFGGVFSFISKNVSVTQFSTLQSGLGTEGLIDNLGISPDIKVLLFFIIFGMVIGILIFRRK